jgi:hypothetical protein
VAPGERLDVPFERRGKPEVVEERRVEQVRQIAHRVQRAVSDRLRVAQQVFEAAGGRQLVLRQRQLHPDRRQHLPDLVVQLARDAAALFFLCVNELCRQALEVARVLRLFALPQEAKDQLPKRLTRVPWELEVGRWAFTRFPSALAARRASP